MEKMDNQILLYQTEDGKTKFEVNLKEDSVWLTQEQMSSLFGRDRTVITKHINNAIKDGEINSKSNVQNMHFANSDKPVKIYNLDVIISVGYRVKSLEGVKFRKWATNILKDYIIKGYAVNESKMTKEKLIELTK